MLRHHFSILVGLAALFAIAASLATIGLRYLHQKDLERWNNLLDPAGGVWKLGLFHQSITYEFAMRCIVTLMVLGAALYVTMRETKDDEAQKKWAFGAVGVIFGYWLKS